MGREGPPVVIIGGGCNGTGLARDLAKRGLPVILFEKGDLGRGATGASSGMIHGGPRYLLNDTETTRHSCEDSGYIQKIVPHLLFRVPFLVPVPRKNVFGPIGPMLYDAYFDVYDRFTPLKNGLPHARLSAADIHALEPGMVGDFIGGVTLDEWGIDAGRLCLLNALDAEAHGAKVQPYTEVVGIGLKEGGQVASVQVRPAGGGEVREVACRAVVNCGGPWAQKLAGLSQQEGVRLRPGKGVHIIYEKRLTNFAILTQAVDGREIFIMPYQNETWIGTTDDDFYGDLDDLTATYDEVAYLQEALVRLLPALADQRLIGTRVGVRNTIYGWGVTEDALSRRYDIIDHTQHGRPGFISLAGGKLASYRIQAQEAADLVCRLLGHQAACKTHLHALPGGASRPDPEELAKAFGIEPLAATRMVYRHGEGATTILEQGRESPTGLCVVDAAEPVLECEVRHCLRHEHVTRLGDLMMRCRVAMGADMGMGAGLRCAQIMAEERGLSVADERAQLMDLMSRRWRSARPVLWGQQLVQAELLMSQYTGLWAEG